MDDMTVAALPDLHIDPVGGRWEERVFEEELFFHHNITSGNYKKNYYLPVEYPQLMIQPEKFYELADGLFYVAKGIEWSIEDVRCQMDVKLSAGENTPLAMNDMGMLVFNPTGDMLIADRQYPYADPAHHSAMVHIIENSFNKVTSDLLECELNMNNWPDFQLAGQKGILQPSDVPLRDPRFFEKNNVAETVQFSAGWTSDVGLRIPMHFLLCPAIIQRTGQSRFHYNALTQQWELMKKKCTMEELVTFPVDYRSGVITSPPSSDESMFQACMRLRGSTDDAYTYSRKRIKLAGDVAVSQECPFPSDQDDMESCFNQSLAPMSTEQWLGQKWRDMKTAQSLIRTDRQALWTKQEHYPLRPRHQAFTGNKTMKPLYIRFDVARKGKDILPYWTYFKFRYKFTLQVYKYTPQLERPIFQANASKQVRYNPQETEYAGDMLYQVVRMPNPFIALDSTKGNYFLPNAWNKLYIPDFQKMYKF